MAPDPVMETQGRTFRVPDKVGMPVPRITILFIPAIYDIFFQYHYFVSVAYPVIDIVFRYIFLPGIYRKRIFSQDVRSEKQGGFAPVSIQKIGQGNLSRTPESLMRDQTPRRVYHLPVSCHSAYMRTVPTGFPHCECICQ